MGNVGRHPKIRLAVACESKRLGGVPSINKTKIHENLLTMYLEYGVEGIG
jgi:hypothetical protein